MNKLLLSSVKTATLISALAIVAWGCFGQNTVSTVGRPAFAVEDSEAARIEHLFSNGSNWTRPAPLTWSSRLQVRWNARFDQSAHYAV
jgi:hypothetical protein